jgi:membrane-associated phospholipid phosphatase
MESEMARAAQTLADHALLLLAAGIVLVGLALAAILAAGRLAGRYRKPLIEGAMWMLGQVRRIPVLGRVFAGARVIVPSRYIALHLVLGLVAIAAVMAFVIIAEEVVAGRSVAAFDRAFADALQNSAAPAWQQVFRVITWFGSTALLLVVSAAIAAGLVLRQQYVLAVGWTIGQLGGAVLNMTLKNAFERTRPDSADAFLLTWSWSFPSGHAMSTFVFCGLGAYLLLRFTRSWMTIAAVVALAFTWSIVMAFTRLYLGVHFLSDVVAGLIAATAWVAVCVSGIEIGLNRATTTRR